MLSFLLLNASAALLAMLIARSAQARSSTATVLLTALAAYLVAIHSIVLLTGVTGHLTVGAAAVALVVAMAVTAPLAWRVPSRPSRSAGEPWHAPELYAVLAAVAAVVLWMWPHLTRATRLWIWDDYTYHMIYPALWLREHAVRAAGVAHAFTMQAWYPLSASTVAAWFMLPFQGSRGDALAWVSLTGPLYAGIVICAAAVLLERVGCRRGAWAIAAALFATSHRIDVMASSFSDADLAHAAALFGAFAFSVPRAAPETRRDVAVDTWYAALLSGLALGIKVSGAAPAGIIAAMAALRARAAAPAQRAWLAPVARVALVFAVGWAATGAYWYARNAIHTGNPLYPAAFLIWPGVRFPETTLLEYSRRYGVARAISDALAVYVNWPALHAGLAIAGLLGLAVWVASRRRRVTRAQGYFAAGALAITAAVLVLLPVTPYSAGNWMTFRSGFVHWDSMRYIALLPLLGWTALAFLVDSGAGAGQARALVAVIVTTAALITAAAPFAHRVALVIALAITAAVASRVLLWSRGGWPSWPRRDVLAAAGLLLLIAANVGWRHHAKASATAEMFYSEPLFGGAIRALDRLPPGTRIGVFGDQWIFPAFGDRDQLVPVRLDGDGRLPTDHIGGSMGPGEPSVDPAEFVSNLRRARIDVAVVLYLPHPGRPTERPAQERALESSGAARLLFRNGAATVWRLDE